MFFSASASADCSGHSCTNVSISRLIVEADGGVTISTSGDESKLDCNAGQNGYIWLNSESKNYHATYSLLLSAHTLSHPIWIRTNDGESACQLVYVVSDK
jgi:hypothetical protein